MIKHQGFSRKALALTGLAAAVLLFVIGLLVKSQGAEVHMQECMIDNIFWHILT